MKISTAQAKRSSACGAAAAEYLILTAVLALMLCSVQHLFRPDAFMLAFTHMRTEERDPPPDGQASRGVIGGGTNEGKTTNGRNQGHGRDGDSN